MTPMKKTKWDVSDIDTWGPDKHELGATIPTAGNSFEDAPCATSTAPMLPFISRTAKRSTST